MGAVKNNWNAMEVAEQAPDISTSSQIQIRYSSQSVDPSLPLPQITPLVKYVSISLPLFTFSGDSSSFSSSCFCVPVSLFLSFCFRKENDSNCLVSFIWFCFIGISEFICCVIWFAESCARICLRNGQIWTILASLLRQFLVASQISVSILRICLLKMVPLS